MSFVAKSVFVIATLLSANGCVLIAAAGAGYMVHDEATEKDGKFDPLEKVRGVEDGEN